MNDESVGRFFDALSTDYTAVIERCFPRYREMLWTLLDYLPAGEPGSILELGCGTGNLTVLLSEAYPEATIRFVDVAEESLDVCRSRLGTGERFIPVRGDFRDPEATAGRYDLVVSSIAVHHLPAPEKRSLFARVHEALVPGGVFTFADQFRGATDDLYARHIANWKSLSLSASGTEEEFAMWMDHQREHDHHDTLRDQMEWLTETGFTEVDCVWRCLLWCVVRGRRPA